MLVVLVGFMGTGKTVVGRALAERLQLDFIDTDEQVEKRAGKPITEIFDESGEAAFRELERAAAAKALGGKDRVVALGGGAVEDTKTRERLRGAAVVHLAAGFDHAMTRIGDPTTRPVLGLTDPWALYEDRRATYEEIANLVVNTDELTPEQVAEEIANRLEHGIERVTVEAPGGRYDVIVGRTLLSRLDLLLPDFPQAELAFVVTQDSAEPYAVETADCLEARGLSVTTVQLPDGEKTKSVATAASLWERLAEESAHRCDLVVGVGGGVVTDLAGFVGATYSRGMPVVQVPTTLLGQVDASIGGKTGVNLSQGKNLVGAIYQPAAVICDVDTLASLPAEELRAGLAEVVKYGFIAEPELLDLLEQRAEEILNADPELLLEVVVRCARIKAAVVSADERERGIRAHLNYGHTFGHAIEHVLGYGNIRHGEAVALGMMGAAHLAHELSRIDDAVVTRHRDVLSAVGLPVSADLDVDALKRAWLRDKKYRHAVRFVLLNGLGSPEAGVIVPDEAAEAAVKRLRS